AQARRRPAPPPGASRGEVHGWHHAGAARSRRAEGRRLINPRSTTFDNSSTASLLPHVRCAMELLIASRTRAAAACAVLATLGGCELMREPTPLDAVPEMIAVHALLVAGQDAASVLLTRPDRHDPGGTSADPVPGASVRLIRGEQSIELVPGGDCAQRFGSSTEPDLSAGCYTGAVPGGIVPGARYELEVTLPGGGTITGATTVPEPPTLLAPAPGAEIEV